MIDEIKPITDTARYMFDTGLFADEPIHIAPDALQTIAAELADLQVVLYCAAEALAQLGHPIDLAEQALAKAQNDIPRGVRRQP